jgi:hypothetical protein
LVAAAAVFVLAAAAAAEKYAPAMVPTTTLPTNPMAALRLVLIYIQFSHKCVIDLALSCRDSKWPARF